MGDKTAKKCLQIVNVILLVLSIVVLGISIYMYAGNSLPFADSLTPYLMTIIILSVVTGIFALLGICASFEGCWLWVYSIVVTILLVCCVAVTVGLIIIYYMMSSDDDTYEFIETIDKQASVYIEEYKNEWVDIQNQLKCCGYGKIGKTGSSCIEERVGQDCRQMLFSFCETYCFGSAIGFIIVTILLAINCVAACKLWCTKNKN
ncbi:hypothetical protein WA158_001757 [Blastocystis sp. Blastoise]